MTPDQIIREEFERWALGGGPPTHVIDRNMFRPDEYRLSETNRQWIVWKAAWAIATGYSA